MILLQNSTKIYYKMRELFYYKMRQVLQNAMILLQNATVITKSDVYYKICLYTQDEQSVIWSSFLKPNQKGVKQT